MRASRSSTRERTNLLTATPDEAALAVADALGTARDLLCLCLCLACPRFAAKTIADDSEGGQGCAAAAARRMSIVEEAARRRLASATAQERGWVPRRGGESYLGLLHELETLRAPLAWTHAGMGGMTADAGRLACGCAHDPREMQIGVYACGTVMRAGQHMAEFTFGGVESGTDSQTTHLEAVFGVDREAWRSTWAASDGTGSASDDDLAFPVVSVPTSPRYVGFFDRTDIGEACLLYGADGSRFPRAARAPGMPAFSAAGQAGFAWDGAINFNLLTHTDRIGMLLDYDSGGSMSVYKNDILLGVMQSGLAGEFCWSLEISDHLHVRIASAQIPPPAAAAADGGED